MARMAHKVVSEMKDVEMRVVYTKTLEGATRGLQLSMRTGRQVPVPSIFIDGELAFDTIPTEEELRKRLLTANGEKT